MTFGTLNFAAGHSSLTINVFVTDDALVEGDEVFSVALTGATGGAGVGVPGTARVLIIDNDTAPQGVNPIDDSTFFVRQHYRGFLNRDPDAQGLAFWTSEIEKCGPDAQPDADFNGYNFWLGKLNKFQGGYIKAEMVKAFISSDECRKRFGQ